MRIIKQPDTFSFAGNPILYEVETDDDSTVIITVTVESEVLVLSRQPFSKRLRFDISDLVQTYFKDIAIADGAIVMKLEDFTSQCTVKIETTNAEYTHTITLFQGGIPNWMIKELAFSNKNMFSYRLFNYSSLFLFTTRTNSHHLYIRETESFPIPFIHPGVDITFISINRRVLTFPRFAEGTMCVMDLHAIRRGFYEMYNELPSYVNVQVFEDFAFDITYLPNAISDEVYYLKFKNSIGGYEVIEIAGVAQTVPVIAEEKTWNTRNEHNFFEENRQRTAITETIQVEVGYKTPDELSFLLDMVSSDEIYFKQGEIEMRCHVTAEEPRIPFKTIEPGTITLTIRAITEERFHSPRVDYEYPQDPALVNITRIGRPRLNANGILYHHYISLHHE